MVIGKTTRTAPDGVIWEGAALGAYLFEGGASLVRKTTDGQYAVIVVTTGHPGPRYRVLKVLPTEARARAYNAAVNR